MRAILLLAIAALGATVLHGRAADVDARHALAMTQQYLARWEATLVALVANEQYDQELHGLRGWGSAGRRVRDARRRLSSEVLLVRAPADNAWLSFRDVMGVDGTAVHDRQRRFDDLFSGPAANVASSAALIGQEGARFNLGPFRTLNTPTAPLVFLTNPYAANTEWKLESARLEGRRIWLLRYIQRKPPFAVNTFGKPTDPLTGRFWIEPGSGRILQGELVVKGAGMVAKVLVKYEPVKAIDSWAPVRMEDSYESSGQIVKGVATYTNHRLFRTAARIIPRS
jgi:hypothetical protein